MKKRLKINAFIILGVILLMFVFPQVFFRQGNHPYFEMLAKAASVALILFGALLRICGRGFKAEHSKNSQALITNGPYALVRNPMYLGILCIGLGFTLAIFRWWVGIAFLAVFTLRYILLIFSEEEKLTAFFSRDYRLYREKVPRLFPSLKSMVKGELSAYLPVKLSWVKKEAGSAAGILVFILLADLWGAVCHGKMELYLQELLIFFIFLAAFAGLLAYLKKDVSIKSQNPL